MSVRQEKVNRLLQKELGDIFQKESSNFAPLGTFITVSGVKISPDLSIANVYISIFPEQQREPVMINIQLYHKEIRKMLAQRIRNQVRIIPELRFFVDDTQDYVQRLEKIFKELHQSQKDTDTPTDVPPEQ
ncbi:MAG: 30S ribosome-binding factor RbfA [Bacteroidia bacterium]|nr:30S ribosome-binding factor RbfA [Bacteroidia bacterium]MDW8301490.1 30S ribosome-binding factor RbfA [Bacteroidia bacterium]